MSSLPPNGKSIVLKGTTNDMGRVTFNVKIGGQEQNLSFSNNLFSSAVVNKQCDKTCKSPLGYDENRSHDAFDPSLKTGG
jgi:hypothetical protein